MKLKKFIPLFSCFICWLLRLSGFSLWNISGSLSKSFSMDTFEPVAYFGSRYFSSLDTALAEAQKDENANTIYIVPGANPTISYSHSISSNDTLVLPYEDDFTNHTLTTVKPMSPYLAYKSGKCTSKVTITNKATLTNNGKIQIGAIQNSGSGGNPFNGNATEKYADRHLINGAALVNKGTIDCYGYISSEYDSTQKKTTGSFQNYGTVNGLFTIVEHRGGSVYTGMSSSNVVGLLANAVLGGATADLTCFPFDRYFVDSLLNIDFTFYSGSKLFGLAVLHADEQDNSTTLPLIGTDDSCLFNLGSGTKIEGIYDKNDRICHLTTKGSWSLHSLNLNLTVKKSSVTGNISLSSSKVYLPRSYYYDFCLSAYDNGNLKTEVDISKQKVKLLPGSKLTINPNVKLIADSIAVYKNEFLYPNGEYIVTRSGKLNVGNSVPYPQKDDALLIDNGYLECNTFGGKAFTSSNKGYLKIKSANSLSSPEVVSAELNWLIKSRLIKTLIGQRTEINGLIRNSLKTFLLKRTMNILLLLFPITLADGFSMIRYSILFTKMTLVS